MDLCSNQLHTVNRTYVVFKEGLSVNTTLHFLDLSYNFPTESIEATSWVARESCSGEIMRGPGIFYRNGGTMIACLNGIEIIHTNRNHCMN